MQIELPPQHVVLSFEEFDRLRAEAKRAPDTEAAILALQDEIRSLRKQLDADPGTRLSYILGWPTHE